MSFNNLLALSFHSPLKKTKKDKDSSVKMVSKHFPLEWIKAEYLEKMKERENHFQQKQHKDSFT